MVVASNDHPQNGEEVGGQDDGHEQIYQTNDIQLFALRYARVDHNLNQLGEVSSEFVDPHQFDVAQVDVLWFDDCPRSHRDHIKDKVRFYVLFANLHWVLLLDNLAGILVL